MVSFKNFFNKLFNKRDDSMTEEEYVDGLPDGEPEPSWDNDSGNDGVM